MLAARVISQHFRQSPLGRTSTNPNHAVIETSAAGSLTRIEKETDLMTMYRDLAQPTSLRYSGVIATTAIA